MAFVWGIDPEGDADFTVFENSSECGAVLPIGYDDESDNTISIFVAISPKAGGDHEHVFSIVDADPRTQSRYEHWSGDETKNLFSRSDRAQVLGLVCAATGIVLNKMTPACVWHYTHASDLPPKALRKHQVIMGVFRDANYKVKRVKPVHGQHAWVATLPT